MNTKQLKLFLYSYKCIPGSRLKSYYANWFVTVLETRSKWAWVVRRQAAIRWAYDGSLGQPRECEEWQRKVWGVVTHLFSGTMPEHFVLDAMLEHEDTPIILLARINLYYTTLKIIYSVQEEPKWKLCTLFTLVGILAGLHI